MSNRTGLELHIALHEAVRPLLDAGVPVPEILLAVEREVFGIDHATHVPPEYCVHRIYVASTVTAELQPWLRGGA